MGNIRIFLLEKLGPIKQKIRYAFLKINGYNNISAKAIIESNVLLDKVYPYGIMIGDYTLVAANVTILCHEHILREKNNHSKSLLKSVSIGKRCFIGVGAMILPGVSIGNDCIIGAGSVVVKSIPDGSVSVGNPAKVIKSGIKMNRKAMIEFSD